MSVRKQLRGRKTVIKHEEDHHPLTSASLTEHCELNSQKSACEHNWTTRSTTQRAHLHIFTQWSGSEGSRQQPLLNLSEVCEAEWRAARMWCQSLSPAGVRSPAQTGCWHHTLPTPGGGRERRKGGGGRANILTQPHFHRYQRCVQGVWEQTLQRLLNNYKDVSGSVWQFLQDLDIFTQVSLQNRLFHFNHKPQMLQVTDSCFYIFTEALLWCVNISYT